MEISVFQLLLVTVFPSGVLPAVSPIPRQYHLITELKTWLDAQTYCRANYADLATVENYMDLIRLQREAQRLGFTAEAWVGLYNDITSWRCSLGEVPLGWTKWGPDQPNNGNAKDECVMMKDNEEWYDLPCLTLKAFICYDETISSQDKFVYYSDGKTWMEARDYCRQIHTDLACPTTPAENLLLRNKFSNGLAWIGFYRDAWKWSDSTNSSGLKWSWNQPDNAGGNQNCAYVVKSHFSSSFNPFIWHFWWIGGGTSSGSSDGWFDDVPTPKKRQVLRVVVQSDQDVNDPTVKAALLQKIQQKLKEQGMTESLTLRWRERSDGTVFYEQRKGKRENVENNTTRVCEL